MLDVLHKNVTWRAIPIAAFVAGTVFLLMNMFLNPILYDIDAFFILRYFASFVFGVEALEQASGLQIGVGLLLHFGLSVVFTLVITIVIHHWGLLIGIIGGAALGLAIYAINFYTLVNLFDWLIQVNSLLMVVSHIIFGAIAGGIYEALDSYDEGLEVAS